MSVQFESNQGQMVPLKQEDQTQLVQQRRDEKLNAPRLTKFLNRTLDAIASLDQNANLKIHNEMVRCVAYYDGKWDGEVKNGEWVENPAVAGEITPKDNEFKKQIDKLHMEMCRNRISYEVEAVDKSSASMREAAEFQTRRIEVNQNRIETEPFIQGENMSLLLKTIGFRYTFFDRNQESTERSTEMQVMKHLTSGAKMLVCRTCGMSEGRLPGEREEKPLPTERPAQMVPAVEDKLQADADTLEASTGTPCTRCGDTERKQIVVPDSEGLDIQYEEKPSGAVVSVRPDSTMVQLDLNARDIPSSSFLRWRLVLRRCDWEAMFPNTVIPSGDQSQEGRKRSQQQIQSSNSEEWTGDDDFGGSQFEKIEGELVWLDPKVYQRYENKEDEILGGGQIFPAGEKLINPYPQGACVARIGQKILDIYPSNKNECWVMCVYGLREHALHGSGTIALLGPQDTINDENAFIVAHHYYSAAGREFIRDGAIEGGDLPPIDKVGVITNAPDDVGDVTDWAYGRSQPQALAGDVYAFREAMRGSLQDGAGTSSLSTQGAADMKALGTATGVEASRDQAVGRMIPNRKLQAYMGTEWCKQVLELERKNYSPETFLKRAGKTNEKGEVEYTERGVKTFFDSRPTDFIIKPSGFIPTTPAQDKANASDFGQIAAQLAQVPGGGQLLSLIAPKFGEDFSVDEWGAAQRSASMRLEEYSRVSEIVSGGGYPPSPEMVQVVLSNCAEWAKPDPEMDNHGAFRNFYQDWWLSDEGRNADSLLRMVVKEVHRLHGQGNVSQAQQQSSDAIAAKAPQMAVQEQLQQEQESKLQEQSAQADAQSKQDAVQEAIGQQMLTERDREHAADVEVDKHAQKAVVDTLAKQAEPTATSS